MFLTRHLPAAFVCLLLASASLLAQPVADEDGDVGVGTVDPDPSAMLELNSTARGMLIPRMTTADRNAIVAPAEGLLIYNLDDGSFHVYGSGSGAARWDTLLSTGNNAGWLTHGNVDQTDYLDNILGTRDAMPVRIYTNNTERMVVDVDGQVGIGTSAPSAHLDINDSFGADPSLRVNGTLGNSTTVEIQSTLGTGSAVAILSNQNTGPSLDIQTIVGGGPSINVTNIVGSNPGINVQDIAGSGHGINVQMIAGTGDALMVSSNGAGNAITAFGDVVINGDQTNVGTVDISGPVFISGDETITGNILPGVTNAFDLGSPTRRWDQIYVNGLASIHLGDVGNEVDLRYNPTAGGIGGMEFDFDGVLGTPQLTIFDNGNLSTVGTMTSGGAINVTATGNAMGNGAGSNQLLIRGVVDATAGVDTYPANAPKWDLAVEGDIVATGIIKTGGSMWIDGVAPNNHVIHSSDDLQIRTTGAGNDLSMTSSDSLVVNAGNGIRMNTANTMWISGQAQTPGPGINPKANPLDHVLVVENRNQGGAANGNGVAIIIHDNRSDWNNNFLSFYHENSNAVGAMAGRVEGFSYQDYIALKAEIDGLLFTPEIYNPFNYFTFNVNFNPNFIQFSGGSLPSLTGGSLPSLTGGSLPSLDIDWADFDFDFSSGSLPTLNVGSFPTFNPGSLPTITFDYPITFDDPVFEFTPGGDGTLVSEVLGTLNPGLLWDIYSDPIGSALKFEPWGGITNFRGGVTYESGAGDYAEWLERKDPSEEIMIGEVVGMRGGKISKATEGAEEFMVISWKPAVLGNMPEAGKEDDYEKVAFLGQIPVRTRGTVEVGDYLIPSGLEDGTARAIAPDALTAAQAAQVIGVSWEASTIEGAKLVKAAVGMKPHEYMQVIRNQKERIDDLERRLQEIERKLLAQ